jgi:hypothetical protein
VDHSSRWDSRFRFEKVEVVDASLPEAVIASLMKDDWGKENSR